MIDIAKRIENTFKDAVTQACMAQGIDAKSEAGWCVGGGGVISPMVSGGELQGFGPTWFFTLSLRSLLLGQEPVAGSLPIHDVLPTDAQIRLTAQRLVADVQTARKAMFEGGS
jgi:hypothetical protein